MSEIKPDYTSSNEVEEPRNRYTRDDRFLNLVSQTAAGTGSPALLIHLLPGSEKGREFMGRYGIAEAEMPALVAIADWNLPEFMGYTDFHKLFVEGRALFAYVTPDTGPAGNDYGLCATKPKTSKVGCTPRGGDKYNPPGADRERLRESGRIVSVHVYRTATSVQLRASIEAAFQRADIELRTGEWEFMDIIGRNRLRVYTGGMNGQTLFERYPRSDCIVYITRRGAGEEANQPQPPQEHPHEEPPQAQNEPTDGQAPPQAAVEEVDAAMFQNATVDPGVSVIGGEEVLHMLRDLQGPHVSSLICSGRGAERPLPLPLSPMAAEHISAVQERPLAAAVGLTSAAADRTREELCTESVNNMNVQAYQPDAAPRKGPDKIIKALDKHFKPLKNTVYERYKFTTCEQAQGESIEAYVERLRKLVSTCDCGALKDEMLPNLFSRTVSGPPWTGTTWWNRQEKNFNKAMEMVSEVVKYVR
ncbi:hypothetical protein Bbelb_350370 [Branchiostoma belcheri]|nr:hypothetical protein Bbelb_350370 [Branchiostoma belcheri]